MLVEIDVDVLVVVPVDVNVALVVDEVLVKVLLYVRTDVEVLDDRVRDVLVKVNVSVDVDVELP